MNDGVSEFNGRRVFRLHPVMATAAPSIVLGASAQAIISEIEECALRFLQTGENCSIDLSVLNAMPEERQILKKILGQGEVSAIVNSLGQSHIHETSVPCVWWVSHFGEEREILGEWIEIDEIPDVLRGDREDVPHQLIALRTRTEAAHESPFDANRTCSSQCEVGHGRDGL